MDLEEPTVLNLDGVDHAQNQAGCRGRFALERGDLLRELADDFDIATLEAIPGRVVVEWRDDGRIARERG